MEGRSHKRLLLEVYGLIENAKKFIVVDRLLLGIDDELISNSINSIGAISPLMK